MAESAFFWSSAPASPPSPSTSGVHFTADCRIQLRMFPWSECLSVSLLEATNIQR